MDEKGSDFRALKQAIKILQDVASDDQKRRQGSDIPDGALPSKLLADVELLAKQIGSALGGVWDQYCLTDMPGLLSSLSATWSGQREGTTLLL